MGFLYLLSSLIFLTFTGTSPLPMTVSNVASQSYEVPEGLQGLQDESLRDSWVRRGEVRLCDEFRGHDWGSEVVRRWCEVFNHDTSSRDSNSNPKYTVTDDRGRLLDDKVRVSLKDFVFICLWDLSQSSEAYWSKVSSWRERWPKFWTDRPLIQSIQKCLILMKMNQKAGKKKTTENKN